jgi:NitT/TauT family transport system substrate-binding protein
VRSGAVDALCHHDPLMSWLEYKNDVRVVAETRSLQGAQLWMGGPVAATCLFSKVEFIQAKPEWVQGLTDGVVRALKWLVTAGPTDFLKNAPPQSWLVDRAFYLGTIDKVRESYCMDGLFGNDLLTTVWRSRAVRLGQARPSVVDRPALQAAYTNEWAQKSKKRFAV